MANDTIIASATPPGIGGLSVLRLSGPIALESLSSVSKKHVLRGIHGDYNTAKLINCLEGEFYLVVVNNIPDHKQFRQWVSFNLSEYNRYQVFVPPGFGNGHLVLTERAIFSYKQSSYYNPKGQFTILWNDPKLNLCWPINNPILSKRDQIGHFID